MEESGTTTEQLALIGFAARLGTCVSKEDGSIANDGDLRQEAQLLMNLMSSTPSSSIITDSSSGDEGMGESAAQMSEDEEIDVPPKNSGSWHPHFAFSCPSLSLDASSFHSRPSTVQRQVTDDSSESIDAAVQPPAVLLSRPLGVDDRDAMRLSAEAMARNILQSFHTAVQWRIDTWVKLLAHSLVCQERELLEQDASEDDLRELLQTPEARVLASLQHGAARVDVVDARTSYRVRPQRMDIDPKASSSSDAPPTKKRKLERKSAGTYRVKHALSFQAVLNLSTPAGFTEVTLEAPGIIEGVFVTAKPGEETLTGVSVQIDTQVLARMMEMSSRIVARTATKACLEARSEKPMTDKSEPRAPEYTYTPQQEFSTAPSSDSEEPPSHVGVVTPRYPSPPLSAYGDKDPEILDKLACFPLSDDLERTIGDAKAFLRMISPRRSQGLSFTPRTPTKSQLLVPTLVSPHPSNETELTLNALGPSLPALVAAACNAMRTSVA
jgi:hypothetical protein